jgi:hypothetical protein
MSGEIFTGTKYQSFFCVPNLERLKYLQNYSVKYKSVDKIEDRRVSWLKRAGHV